MKTIEQIKDCQAIDLGYNSFNDLVLHPKKDMKMNHINWCIERSIKEYATQVAEQVLKDANNRLNEECKDFGGLQPELSEIILSTPIITP